MFNIVTFPLKYQSFKLPQYRGLFEHIFRIEYMGEITSTLLLNLINKHLIQIMDISEAATKDVL